MKHNVKKLTAAFLAVFLSGLMIFSSAWIPIESSAAELESEVSSAEDELAVPEDFFQGNNLGENNYNYQFLRYGDRIYSYLVKCSDGNYMRFQVNEYRSLNGYLVEYYDENFNYLSNRIIEPMLDTFGGFYSTGDYYIIVTGQNNSEESNYKDVLYITKYDTNWNLISSSSMSNINTRYFFSYGSLRFAQSGDILMIHTCHTVYKSDDGKTHQGNATIEYSLTGGGIISFSKDLNYPIDGVVAHSYNQFAKIENNKLITLDHGDEYPRGIIMHKYQTDIYSGFGSSWCKEIQVVNIPDAEDYHDTGISIGGFEISDSSYLVAGSSIDYSSYSIGSFLEGLSLDTDKSKFVRDIFVSAVSKNDDSVTYHKITNYSVDDCADNPYLVKINDNRFLLIWTVNSISGAFNGTFSTGLYYTEIDGKGNRVSDIYKANGELSDCAPIVDGDKIVWYTWFEHQVNFYEIDLKDIANCKRTVLYNNHNILEQDFEDSTVEVLESGICSNESGYNGLVKYKLYNNGNLYIYGSGQMGNFSFSDDDRIQKVFITDHVASVSGFSGSKSIKEVYISSNDITQIYGFINCTNLEKVVLPESLTAISSDAFYNCTSLTEVELPKSVEYIGSSAFRYTNLAKIDIPNKITQLSDKVFYGCKNLTEVNLPNSLIKIGNNTFEGCTNLKEIVLPSSLNSVGDETFKNCSGLEEVILPDSLSSIGVDAFYNCSSLENIVIPKSLTSISWGCFRYCSSLREIEIPINITNIASNAFQGCFTLSSVIFNGDMPDNDSLFEDVITVVYYPDNNETWANAEDGKWSKGIVKFVKKSLYGKEDIELVSGKCGDNAYVSILQSGKTRISGSGTLDGIMVVKDINNKYKFVYSKYVYRVTDVTIDYGITYLDDYSFQFCKNLKSIVIPDSVTGIHDDAFKYASDYTIKGYQGSVANIFADKNNVPFISLDHTNEFATTDKDKSIDTDASVTKLVNNSTISATTVNTGSKVALRGAATGGTGSYSYGYYYKKTSASTWTKIGTGAYVTFTPAAGTYNVKVNVVDGAGTVAAKTYTLTVKTVTPLTNTSTISATTVNTGSKVALRGAATGGTGSYSYGYYYKKTSASTWTKIGTGAYVTFTPAAGTYNVKVNVVDGAGTVAAKTYTLTVKTVTPLTNTSTVSTTSVNIGAAVTIKSSATGGTAPYNYGYYYKNSTATSWTKLGSGTSTTFKPTTAGTYNIKVNVMDSTGKVVAKTFTVKANAVLTNTSTVSSESVNVGTAVTIKGAAAGGTAPYNYGYYYKNSTASSWTKLGSGTSVTFKPTTAGIYNIKVNVMDSTGKVVAKTFTVKANAVLTNTSTVSSESVNVGAAVTIKGAATGGTAPYNYGYYYKNSTASSWTKLGTGTSATFKPTEVGTYNIKVNVLDSTNKIVTKMFTIKVNANVALTNTSTVSSESVNVGTAVTIKGAATGGTAPYNYGYYYKNSTASSWTKLGSGTSATFKPTAVGTYNIKVNVLDGTGKVIAKTFTVKVNDSDLKNTSTVSATTINVGGKVTIKGAATGGTAPYSYGYYYKISTSSNWVKLGTGASTSFAPTAPATYNIKVNVMDSTGKVVSKTFTVKVN